MNFFNMILQMLTFNSYGASLNNDTSGSSDDEADADEK